MSWLEKKTIINLVKEQIYFKEEIQKELVEKIISTLKIIPTNKLIALNQFHQWMLRRYFMDIKLLKLLAIKSHFSIIKETLEIWSHFIHLPIFSPPTFHLSKFAVWKESKLPPPPKKIIIKGNQTRVIRDFLLILSVMKMMMVIVVVVELVSIEEEEKDDDDYYCGGDSGGSYNVEEEKEEE